MSLPVTMNFDDPEIVPEETRKKFQILNLNNVKDTRTEVRRECPFLGICFDIPVPQKRTCDIDVFAIVTHPEIDDIINDVEECLVVALTKAIIALILTNDLNAASATLTIGLRLCLEMKGVKRASQVSISIEDPIKKNCSEWEDIIKA